MAPIEHGSQNSTIMNNTMETAELLSKISTLEQTIERQDRRLSDRRRMLVAKRFLAEDLTNQMRREQMQHDVAKAKYNAQASELRDLREDKEAHDAIIRGIEHSLKDARDHEAKLQQALDKAQSNIKAYKTGAIAALILFPSLKKVAAFQKLVELSQQETRGGLPESTEDQSILEEKCDQEKAVPDKLEPSHLVVTEDSPTRPRKRKAKDVYVTSDPSTNHRATPQGEASISEANGLLSPPPSARKRQPRRAVKSEYNGIDGFYKIMNTGSHLQWE